jgi:hypothetical protein
MSNAIMDAVKDALGKGITDNGEIAHYVRQAVPGAATTSSSVASMKSRLRKDGHEVPRSLGRPQASYGNGADGGDPDAFKRPDALPDHDPNETIEEAARRIAVRYDALERMSRRIAQGKVPSLIVSGPPGLGKSYTIKAALEEQFPDGPEVALEYREDVETDGEGDDPPPDSTGELKYDIVSGSISAVGLYQALWYTRNGGILVLDDADDIFRDETALNILKAALDSSPVRTISWRKEAKWLEDYGIADRFAYKGHVIFLTNIDFETIIQSGKRDSEHFKALIDRSLYLCLTLRSRRDFMIRIRQVSEGPEGMLATQFGCNEQEIAEVLDFVAEHQTRFYNLSLRLVGQVAVCRTADPERWQQDVEATKMRTM